LIQRLGALHSIVAVALALAYALSFAALIFSGPMRAGFAPGVFAALAAVGIGGLVVACFSKFPVAMAGPDSNPTAVLGLAAVSLVWMSPATRVPTMLTIVLLTTVVTGATLIALGSLRASRLIRFIPEPMIGGFNAASGTLVMLGSLHVLGHNPPLALLAASLAMGLVVIVCSQYFGPVSIPAIFVLSLAVSPFVPADWHFVMPRSTPWFPWSALYAQIDVRGLLYAIPAMLIVAIVSAATLLFNETGLELLTGKDVDLDRELRVTGIANLASSLLGGMVSFVSFSRTSMNVALGVRSRSVGIIVALVALAAMAIGPWNLIAFVPIFSPAGLLIALGGNVAYRWLIAERSKQAVGDFITVWAIVIAIVWLGFVPGIVIGLAVGCVTFVVRYGRIDAVQHRWRGDTVRSSLERSAHESEVLTQFGDRIRIFKLRGFIFFGVADRLYRELLRCAEEVDGIMWIIVDFAGVTGMDSSAAGAFVKFARSVDADRVQFMLCGMSQHVQEIWNSRLDDHLRPLTFEGRDEALEYCEGQVLMLFDSYAETPIDLDYWLALQFGTHLAGLIRGGLERVDLDTGDVLCTRGEAADRMFFVEKGRVAVLIGEESLTRLRSVGRYAIIGEMGLYNRAQRTATVVAEMPCVVYALTRDALDAIEATDPVAATAFHAAIVRTLADRLEHQNGLIASMAF
jgi:sulfate permease, SulP family